MEHLDLSGHPEFDVCNLPFSQEIRDRIEFFEERSLIVWIGKNRPFTDTGHVADAFASRFGIGPSSIHVSRHCPLDLLVTILDRDTFEEVANRRSFSHGGRDFRLRRWSPRDQATRAAMRYYVHLCLEGLPLHLWSESFAAKVIGRSCSLHFAEEHSSRRESTEVFDFAAGTADAVTIPLLLWLTVTDPDFSSHASSQVVVHRQRPREPKRRMVYDGIMNLSSVKDTRRLGPDGKPLFFPLHFSLGATDADQNVAPGHALREDQKSSRAGMTVLAAPLLHHGTLALWSCTSEDDECQGAVAPSCRAGAVFSSGCAGLLKKVTSYFISLSRCECHD
jgi:hypothetical protein